MCIIIAKDAGVKALDKEYFERAWENNPHGGGIVWKNAGEDVHIQKGFMNKEQFLEKIAEINKDSTSFIAHFRIKSVGEIKPENCHPFVMEKVTFAHNGTLSIQPEGGMTDSETFGRAFLFDKDMAWIEDYKVLLEMALGTSKFAIMDNVTGEITILNKEYGEIRDGAWFSNKSAFPKPAPMPVTPYRGYGRYNGLWDDDDYHIPYTGTTSFRANPNFGTKKFTILNASYKKDRKCFVWNTSQKNWEPTNYKPPIVCDKRGLWKVDSSIMPSDSFKDKTYSSDSVELKTIVLYQRNLDKMINEYHKSTFKTYQDRVDQEEEISGLNTVLNCMRRLVQAKKIITLDTLLSFCAGNVQREKHASKQNTSYEDSVLWYVEEITACIEKATKTDAETVNDFVANTNNE